MEFGIKKKKYVVDSYIKHYCMLLNHLFIFCEKKNILCSIFRFMIAKRVRMELKKQLVQPA